MKSSNEVIDLCTVWLFLGRAVYIRLNYRSGVSPRPFDREIHTVLPVAYLILGLYVWPYRVRQEHFQRSTTN